MRSPSARFGPQAKNFERYNSSPNSKTHGVPSGAPFLCAPSKQKVVILASALVARFFVCNIQDHEIEEHGSAPT